MGFPNCTKPCRPPPASTLPSMYARRDGRSQLYQWMATASTSQPVQSAKKSFSHVYGSVIVGSLHPPQKFTAGETMRAPTAFAAASTAGQFAAACAGVILDWDLKFGSLKPSTYLDPAGSAEWSELAPQIIGTNAMPEPCPVPVSPQSYHHEMPGWVDEGENAAPGAALEAMPRLHGGGPASAFEDSLPASVVRVPASAAPSGFIVTPASDRPPADPSLPGGGPTPVTPGEPVPDEPVPDGVLPWTGAESEAFPPWEASTGR